MGEGGAIPVNFLIVERLVESECDRHLCVNMSDVERL
jgi:hypothetical protein